MRSLRFLADVGTAAGARLAVSINNNNNTSVCKATVSTRRRHRQVAGGVKNREAEYPNDGWTQDCLAWKKISKADVAKRAPSDIAGDRKRVPNFVESSFK